MKLPKLLLAISTFLLLLVMLPGCGDDNSTGPNTNIPTELVGTWWWTSGTVNGDPQTFLEVSFTDTSQTGSVTFSSGNTWNSEEYYNQIVVWTQSGTCSNSGNNLSVTRTMENGTPVDPPDVQSFQWEVIGTSLILSDMEVFMNDTIVFIQTYTKE